LNNSIPEWATYLSSQVIFNIWLRSTEGLPLGELQLLYFNYQPDRKIVQKKAFPTGRPSLYICHTFQSLESLSKKSRTSRLRADMLMLQLLNSQYDFAHNVFTLTKARAFVKQVLLRNV